MSLYKAFLKQSVISTVVVEKKMTMNIFMESCISCFFSLTATKCRLQVTSAG